MLQNSFFLFFWRLCRQKKRKKFFGGGEASSNPTSGATLQTIHLFEVGTDGAVFLVALFEQGVDLDLGDGIEVGKNALA